MTTGLLYMGPWHGGHMGPLQMCSRLGRLVAWLRPKKHLRLKSGSQGDIVVQLQPQVLLGP